LHNSPGGFVFVLDRETGAPLYPVEERRVPASDVPERLANAAFSGKTTALVPQNLRESDLWDSDPSAFRPARRAAA
jgi:quinoprotein glucose dehydrogenase